MKAFFRSFLRALIYPAIYLAIQVVVSVLAAAAAGACYVLRNAGAGQNAEDFINSALKYVIGFINSNVSCLLIVSAVLTLGTIVIVMRKKHANLTAVLALHPVRAFDTALLLVCGVSMNLAIELSLSLIPIPQSVLEQYQNSSIMYMLSGNMALNAFCIVLFIPAVEEAVFRGLAFNRLRSGMSFVPALILQSVIFAAAHVNALQTFYVFFAGIVLGLAYLWSKSLYGSIMLHAAFNCTALVLSQLPKGGRLQALADAAMYASPAVLAAALILLFRSSRQNQAGPPPRG